MVSIRFFAPLLVLLISLSAVQAELHGKVPRIYGRTLAKMLTPLDEVLKQAEGFEPASDQAGVVLLNERVHFVQPNGSRYVISHLVFKALDDAGVKAIAEDTFRYRKNSQSLSVVSAQTIGPDGTRTPVRPNAVVVQSPQDQADIALYDDSEEIRLIFPKVERGAVTESITITEEKTPRMKDEYTAVFAWSSFWPRMSKRRVVDLPANLAERLQVVNTGSGIAEPKRTQKKNRVRFTWELGRSEGMVYEARRAPPLQTGPATWLSTLPDWDAFAAWYSALIEGKGTLAPALQQQVDAWTKDLESPEEILAVLFDKAANEVRYTGLEFGISALQPYDCNEVWANRYGDCKDKSNLLRAMLAHKGIPAHLVLLQTQHKGLIEKRSPSYRQFDHAILAAEIDGKYVFCDPTIALARPGMLAPSGADRDVLLVKGEQAEWARTPEADPGSTHYTLELKWQPDGTLSGWLTKATDGFYGPWFADHLGRMSEERFEAEMSGLVQRFFPDAELVDASRMTLEEFKGRFEAKAYFVRPGKPNSKGGRQLVFPAEPRMLPATGASKLRLTDRFLWKDKTRLEARIALPEGWNAAELPRPYEIENAAYAARAEWKAEDNLCVALLHSEVRQTVIKPKQYGGFYRSVDALRKWLDRPLLLKASEDAPLAERHDQLKEFVLMPTGEGQLRLVDTLYPKSGNRKLRRSALEKTRQLFPADKPTLFSAEVQLAILDWEDGDEAGASERLIALLNQNRKHVSAGTFAWAEYILALCYRDQDQPEQAAKILSRLARDGNLADFRRTWSAHQAARLIKQKDPEQAIDLLKQTFSFESGPVPENVGLYAGLMARAGRGEALVGDLKQIAGQKLPQYEEILVHLVKSARGLASEDSQAGMVLEKAMVQLAADKTLPENKVLSEGLKTIKTSTDLASVSLEVQQKIAVASEAGTLPYDFIKLEKDLEKREDFERVLREKRNDHASYIRHCLEMLRRFTPNAQFPFYLWSCASKQDLHERMEPEQADEKALDLLLELCEGLPPDNRWYFESRFIAARRAMRKEDLDLALSIYDGLLKNSDISDELKNSALRRKAELFEQMDRWEEALTLYREMEGDLENFPAVGESLLRAVLIHLARDNRAEAFRVLDLLRNARQTLRGDNATQVYSLLEFTKDRKKAEQYWDATAAWWPKFVSLLKALGAEKAGAIQVPTYAGITSVDELSELMRARDEKRFVEAYRQVIWGARWMPQFVSDGANISTFSAVSLFPKQEKPLRELAVALSESLDSEDEAVRRQNLFLLTVNYLELREAHKALDAIHQYNELGEKNPVIERAMVRLWGMAANMSGEDFDEAGAALRNQLNDIDAGSRGMTVNALAEIYRRQGKLKEEEALLKEELNHPAIQANQRLRDALQARYDALALEGEAAEKFGAAVERWIAAQDLPWWDFARPESLKDRKLRKLDRVLENPGALYNAPERLKLFLLVAADSSKPLAQRMKVFEDAVRLRSLYLTRHDELHALYRSIIEDEDFPEQTRRDCHWRGLIDALDERHAERIAYYNEHELSSSFNDRQKDYVKVLLPYAEVDRNDPEALMEQADALLDEEIDSSKLGLLMDVFNQLLQIDALDDAKALYDDLKDIQLDPEVRTTSGALRLSLLKGLNKAKEMAPLHRKLRALVLAHFPEDQIDKPEGFDDWRYPGDAWHLDVERRNATLLYLIKTQRFERATVGFWTMFSRYLVREARDPKTVDLVFNLMQRSLELSPDDLSRAEIIASGAGTIDLDNPEERERYWAICKPWRNRDKHPICFSEIRFREIEMDLRLGKDLNLEEELADLTDELGNNTVEAIKLQYYSQIKRKDLLRQTLDQFDVDQQLSRRWLSESLRAYRILGMKDEALLAQESAEEELYKVVLASWADPKGSGYFSVLDLIAILDTTEGVPAPWLEQTLEKMQYRKNDLYLRMRYHTVQKEWKQVAEAAGELIKLYPNFYDYYWYHGQALYHLGQKKKAAASLTTYTKFSKSDIQYPDAMELLKKIGNE